MKPFWAKALGELTPEEWEALCDGCGRCCLHKLQDEETDEVFYTNVACRLLDLSTGRCRHYRQRQRLVSDCVILAPDSLEALQWLPESCAYRLRADNLPLPSWHPLNTGQAVAVAWREFSVCSVGVSEDALPADEELADHLIPWPE